MVFVCYLKYLIVMKMEDVLDFIGEIWNYSVNEHWAYVTRT